MIKGESLNTDIALDMEVNPINKTPNPRITSPTFWTVGLFINNTIITPAIKKTGAISERLKETSWEVTVVPMLAPRITPVSYTHLDVYKRQQVDFVIQYKVTMNTRTQEMDSHLQTTMHMRCWEQSVMHYRHFRVQRENMD